MPDAASQDKDLQNDRIGALAAADPEAITPQQATDATDWFLNPGVDEDTAWAFLPVNVAPAGKPERIIDFKIQVIDRDRLRQLRREATRPNANGVDEVDEMEANLKIAVEGLLSPDIKGDPKLRKVRGQDYLDPADALRARFAHKPGLIDQIAGRIVQISGYADADVKEVKAAGN